MSKHEMIRRKVQHIFYLISHLDLFATIVQHLYDSLKKTTVSYSICMEKKIRSLYCLLIIDFINKLNN